jgi:hypothetical protein
MSTVLPLLAYSDISNIEDIEYFGKRKPQSRVTHVAVLNYTIEKYPYGALGILLCERPGLATWIRLPVPPVVFPMLGVLTGIVQNTKLLISSGPLYKPSNGTIITDFSVESKSFHIRTWDSEWDNGHMTLATKERHGPLFRIHTSHDSTDAPVRISCFIVCSKDPLLMFTVQLTRMNRVWSIEEVLAPKDDSTDGEGKPCSLFHASTLADRCLVQLPDGKELSVKLIRLPSAARGYFMFTIKAQYAYAISVELNTLNLT